MMVNAMTEFEATNIFFTTRLRTFRSFIFYVCCIQIHRRALLLFFLFVLGIYDWHFDIFVLSLKLER